jgi:hypothetical protein
MMESPEYFYEWSNTSVLILMKNKRRSVFYVCTAGVRFMYLPIKNCWLFFITIRLKYTLLTTIAGENVFIQILKLS